MDGDRSLEKLRLWLAFGLAVVGLLIAVLLAVYIVAAQPKWTSSSVTAVVGLFTSVLGTLVGAFFGFQSGAAGRAEAQQQAEKSSNKLTAFAAAADPEVSRRLMEQNPNFFKP